MGLVLREYLDSIDSRLHNIDLSVFILIFIIAIIVHDIFPNFIIYGGCRHLMRDGMDHFWILLCKDLHYGISDHLFQLITCGSLWSDMRICFSILSIIALFLSNLFFEY